MAALSEKRKEAKELGIPATLIRSAENVRELQTIIDKHTGTTNGKPKAKAKAKGKAKAARKAVKSTPTAKATKRISKSASSKSAPAKSTKKSGTAKRSATAKASRNGDDSGRNTLEGINYSETDGWNPRSGSAPDRIVKALKKFRGNRAKVFDALVDDVWAFAGKKKRDGTKRTKAEAEEMLRYRIARTDWDFALRTGQHEKSENRVEYGTGGTGNGTWKPAKKKAAATKSTKSNSTRSKATAKATTGKRRGRPPGVKNKPKAMATKATARAAGRKAARKNKR